MGKYSLDTKEERDREAIADYNHNIQLEIEERKKQISVYEGLIKSCEQHRYFDLVKFYEGKVTRFLTEIEALINDLIKE